MGAITGGINLGAPILPATEEDIFPTHDEKYGKGGYKVVETYSELIDLNVIKPARRSKGMMVKTLDTGINWILDADLVTWKQEIMDGGSF